VRRQDAGIEYRSRRRGDSHRRFLASYTPEGPELQAVPGSLEYFLTERYCPYTVSQSRVVRVEIRTHPGAFARPERTSKRTHAAPWAEARRRAAAHFAKRQDVLVWPLAYV
jgi:hypothetical protein